MNMVGTCRSLTLAAVLLALLSPIGALAQPGNIKLEGAWARRAPMGGGHGPQQGPGNGAVYIKIVNEGTQGDAVIAARSDAAQAVELHETRNEAGVMRMRPLEKFQIPARGSLEMKPGGHHVMILGLTRDLKPGDRVSVTLTFERAGPMTVEALVR